MSPSPLPCAEPPAGPAEGALSRAELVAMLHLVEGDNAELAAAAHRLAQRVDVLDHACGTGGAVTAMDEVALLRAAATARRAMVAGECRVVAAAAEFARRRAVENAADLSELIQRRVARGDRRAEAEWAQDLCESLTDGHGQGLAQAAVVLGVSEGWLRRRVDAAERLPERLPQVWARLQAAAALTTTTTDADADADGFLDWDKALVILHQTDHLAEATARVVAAQALEAAPALVTPWKLAAFTERAAAVADPVAHHEKTARAIAGRGVRYRALGEGLAQLILTHEASRIEAARAALEALTEAAHNPAPPTSRYGDRALHDSRSRSAVTADALIDALTDAAEALTAPHQTPTGEGSDTISDADADTDTDTDTDADADTISDAEADTISDSDADSVTETETETETETAGSPADSTGSTTAAGTGRSGGASFGIPTPAPTPAAKTRIVVLVPLSTLLGGTAPAELAGHGPIPAQLARELIADAARNATWRCAYTDDRPPKPDQPDDRPPSPGGHGSILGIGRAFHTPTYQPPPMLREFIQLRDGTCRAPGCRRQATACDLDHALAHHRGGPTCDCNLHALCRHHHRLKQTRRGITTPTTTEYPVGYPALPPPF